ADAFTQGNLGIMDYYKFQNIQADTKMRDSISDPSKKTQRGGSGEKPKDE
ncbi:MAG: flotillin-like FloA family protein, partial [Bacteroidales bacterium]|nr:flotillin-like FloA family protein [Bacteroidales bacterium]